ncbi:MAG: ion transporter [Pyrinomonadaceae bacterium MAG19_C2-C3]|nr:ion transporter [Pyrinomonadaceae bacterium MAG19_C2-C3]
MIKTNGETNGETNNEARNLLTAERRALLEQVEDWLELPMLILGFVWLALLIFEFIWGESTWLTTISTVIQIIFVVDFAIKLLLAPDKTDYLKANWLTAIALLVPALRVFRIFRVVRLLRAARVARGLRLLRVVSSLNRGMRALGNTMSRRGAAYVVALTVIVTFAGAAGMYAFENNVADSPIKSYGEALWWTAMTMTTMGSDYFPNTVEGRVLCFLLAVYAFAVFGYVTATLATFFVGRDAASEEAEVVGAEDIKRLQSEIILLRAEIGVLLERSGKGSGQQIVEGS